MRDTQPEPGARSNDMSRWSGVARARPCGALWVGAPSTPGRVVATMSRMRSLTTAALVIALAATPAASLAAGPDAARADGPRHCATRRGSTYPARQQEQACLDDLTTAGTVATGPHRRRGTGPGCTRAGSAQPRPASPASRSTATSPTRRRLNTHHGWNHDAQFVIRLPDGWNGGSSSPGRPASRGSTRTTSSSATGCSPSGYAYAATDKGNSGASVLPRRRSGRATPSPSGTDGSRSWPGPRRRSSSSATAGRRAAPTPRDLQRRLPRALAAGEPPRAVRRRRGLGGHALAPRRAEPARPSCRRRCAPTRRTRRPATTPRTTRWSRPASAGVRVAVGLPLRRLLGPHPADLPRGARPVLRRRPAGRRRRSAQRGTPACDADYDYSSRPAAGPARGGTRSRSPAASGGRWSPCTARSTRCCRSARTPTSTPRWSAAPGRGRLHRYYRCRGRQPRRRSARGVRRPGAAAASLRTARLPPADGLGRARPASAGQRHAAPGRARPPTA